MLQAFSRNRQPKQKHSDQAQNGDLFAPCSNEQEYFA